MKEAHRDLARTTLGVLLIGALIAASFWILRPFLPAIVWATMIVVFTWHFMLRIQRWLWNRRSLAVTVMTLALLIILILPFSLAATTIISNTETVAHWVQSLSSFTLPPMPEWLPKLPLIGSWASSTWTRVVVASHLDDLPAKLAPYAGTVIRFLIGGAGGIGLMFLQFLLTIAFAAIMYAYGERAAEAVIRLGRRLAGDRGETAVRLAAQAIHGVAMGVLLTAIVQSAVIFILCVAQIGPGLVLIPTVAWMYWSGDTVWATVMLIWSVVVLTMDNVLRPVLIKRSAKLPLLLIFIGVIGGLLAFGLIGIFVGPVVLAVAFTLLQAWVAEEEPGPA
jgi:predicted PurR-regulated permease PerM